LTRTFVDAGVLITAARTYVLGAVDALQVAAALELGADGMLTTEGPFKPMFRVPGIRFSTMGR